MSDFRRAMTSLYLALPGLPKADARHYVVMAAQLEAFHAHLKRGFGRDEA